MTASANLPTVNPPIPQQDPQLFVTFEEASPLLKRISAIPIIGIPVSMIQESSLKSKLSKSNDPALSVALIHIKNEYAKSALNRNLLSAALVVAGIAKNILKNNFLFSALIFIGCAALNAYRIDQNEEILFRLGHHIR